MLDERSDDELAQLVRHALDRGDPVPDAMHEAAISAYAFRDLDSALAELVDSLPGVRDGEDGPLVFAVEHAEVAVAIENGRLIGQVAPPAACQGSVELAKGAPVTFQADELGRFAVEVEPGPARIVLEHPDGRVRTDWFPI